MSDNIWKTTVKQEIKDGKVYYYLIKKNLFTGEEIPIKAKGEKNNE